MYSHLIRGSSLGLRDSSPKRLTIGSAVFAGLAGVTKTQTDRQTDRQTTLGQNMRRNLLHLALFAVLAMRPTKLVQGGEHWPVKGKECHLPAVGCW